MLLAFITFCALTKKVGNFKTWNMNSPTGVANLCVAFSFGGVMLCQPFDRKNLKFLLPIIS